LALISVVVYTQSLFFGYTYLDDNVLILDNLFFLKDLSNLGKIFTTEVFHLLHSSAAYYRPILTLSFMFDAVIGGGSLWMFHVTDIAIHIAVVTLLYLVLLKLKVSSKLSFALSAFFAVHPALSQAVSWIPGRNDSLLALFVLASLLTLDNIFLHLIFFALAIFTKESALFLPAVYSFWMFWVRKEKFPGRFMILVLSWVSVVFIWFCLRSIALGDDPVKYSLGSSILAVTGNLSAVFLYFGKMFLPFNLSVLPTLVDSKLYLGIISLVLFVIASVVWRPKNMMIYLFGICLFIIFLLPGFIRPNNFYAPDFLEHRLYLPIIGIIISLSQVVRLDRKLFWVTLIVGLGTLNIFHSQVFSNKLRFWQNAVIHSPSHPLAHKNLGAMYYFDQKYNEAEKEYLLALKISPTEAMVNNNLGLIYLMRGDKIKAEEYFKKELVLCPNYDNAHANLAMVYYQNGDKEKAEEEWLATVEINPDHKETLKNLAIYYSQVKKDPVRAKYYYSEAVKRGVVF
jgi:tetratricopeptide (TPR) repeat protein